VTIHNPNIHALLTKFFTNLGFTTPVWEQPWVTKFNELYTSVNEEKQRGIIDLLAHTKTPTSSRSQNVASWTERNVSTRSVCPALTLVMRAIACKIPLDIPDRQLKYFDGIDHKALQEEVDAQNRWRHNNPYIGGRYYSSTRRFATDNSVFTPTLDNSTKKQFLTMVAATTLTPATSKSVLVVDWAAKNPRPTFSNPTIYNLEGATEFDHQRALNNPAGTIISSDPYTTIIALAHCPNTVAEKYFTHEPFTNEDYTLWANTMENLFPVQELAYHTLHGDITGYRFETNWEYRLATGELEDPFIDLEDYDTMNFNVPAATKLWVHHKMKHLMKPMKLNNTYNF
jgi:hypothetical protein